jgi:myo-inositol-1(or 4)-monophosphatase
VSFPDTVHGGILATALDAAMVHALFAEGVSARTARMDAALLGISFSFKSRPAHHLAVLQALIDQRGVYRFLGSGALGLAYCAAGRVDAFWEDWMMPWDVAAGLILVAEAGGIVSDFGAQGGWQKGNHILASAPQLAPAFSAMTGVALPAERDFGP